MSVSYITVRMSVCVNKYNYVKKLFTHIYTVIGIMAVLITCDQALII